jgi:GxxExxY protein
MVELLYKDLSFQIIGIIFKVFNKLGYGYQEKYYQRAIAIDFDEEGINYIREKEFKLNYHGNPIGRYFLDFIIENEIVLELKVSNSFHSEDVKQILGYLKASGLRLGILVIITKNGIKYKRIVN